MGQLIQIQNKRTEYYKNGNVKSYRSKIYHSALDKSVIVKHKEYDEYCKRIDEAVFNLKKEYETIRKNQYVTEFYKYTNDIVKTTCLRDFNYKDLYKTQQEVNFNERRLEKSTLINDFNVENRPLWSEKYKPKFNTLWIILLPFYLIYFTVMRIKYNSDLNKYNLKKIDYDDYIGRLREYNSKKNKWLNKKTKNRQETNRYNAYIDKILDGYKEGEEEFVIKYVKKAFRYKIQSYIKYDLNLSTSYDFSAEDSTLVCDITFPDEEVFPTVHKYKYIKSRKEITHSDIKKTELSKLIMNAYYNLYIATLSDLFQIDFHNNISSIVLNGYYEGIDKRIGQNIKVCIMTAKVSREKFEQLNLEYVEPSECFNYLKGKGKPNPDVIIKVDPIRHINKEDYKIIDTVNVLDRLSVDTNLAAMDWRDFETLIKDVFEKEFSDKNIEIRNTQHCNDGGIDVVAFNNDLYSGGVILLQAKRYTNTVSPEPVRALRGSMEAKKAIRGIMVTTSNYGKSSYDYAAEHNITLMNGNDLIRLLDKHGYDFHIDLAQAKKYRSNKSIY